MSAITNNSISHLGTEITSQMLAALTLDILPDTDTSTIPVEEQTRYLKRYIDAVSVDDRKDIGNILIMNNKRGLLSTCAAGTIINLDCVPDFVIDQMYNLMMYKMSKRGS